MHVEVGIGMATDKSSGLVGRVIKGTCDCFSFVLFKVLFISNDSETEAVKIEK